MPKPKVKLKSSLRSQRQRWCVAEPEIGDNQQVRVGKQSPRGTFVAIDDPRTRLSSAQRRNATTTAGAIRVRK
jgi:hypothetical protein